MYKEKTTAKAPTTKEMVSHLSCNHCIRKIPWGDQRGDTHGLLDADDTTVWCVGGHHITVRTTALFGIPVDKGGTIRDFGTSLGERFSTLSGDDFGQIVGVLCHQVVPSAKHAGPVLHPRPRQRQQHEQSPKHSKCQHQRGTLARVDFHVLKVSDATSIARSASAAVMSATLPITSPVAGSASLHRHQHTHQTSQQRVNNTTHPSHQGLHHCSRKPSLPRCTRLLLVERSASVWFDETLQQMQLQRSTANTLVW